MPEIEITTTEVDNTPDPTDNLLAERPAAGDDPAKIIRVPASVLDQTDIKRRLAAVENRGEANLGAAAQELIDGLRVSHEAGEITYTRGITSAIEADLTDLTLTGDTDGITLQVEEVGSYGRRIWLRGLADNINKVIGLKVSSVPSGNTDRVPILYIEIAAHNNIQHHLISIGTTGNYEFADPAAADSQTAASGEGATAAQVGDKLVLAPAVYGSSGVSFTVEVVRANGTIVEENTITFNTPNIEGTTPLAALDLGSLIFDTTTAQSSVAKHISKVTVLQRGVGGYLSHNALALYDTNQAFYGTRVEGTGSEVLEQTVKIKYSGGIENAEGKDVVGLETIKRADDEDPEDDDTLVWDGDKWVAAPPAAGGGSTYTPVGETNVTPASSALSFTLTDDQLTRHAAGFLFVLTA